MGTYKAMRILYTDVLMFYGPIYLHFTSIAWKAMRLCPLNSSSEAPLDLSKFCRHFEITWWSHQMETFSALLALCEGNPQVAGVFSSQRLMTWSFDVSFDVHLNKRLSKHSRRRWFDTSWHSLWRHCINLVNSVARIVSSKRTFEEDRQNCAQHLHGTICTRVLHT